GEAAARLRLFGVIDDALQGVADGVHAVIRVRGERGADAADAGAEVNADSSRVDAGHARSGAFVPRFAVDQRGLPERFVAGPDRHHRNRVVPQPVGAGETVAFEVDRRQRRPGD